MMMRKKISFELFVKSALLAALFVAQTKGVKAQTAIRTNLALPLVHLVESRNLGGGFDFGVDTRIFSNSSLRISAYSHMPIPGNLKPDKDAMLSTITYDQIQKNGFRLGLKSYATQGEEEVVFNGLYFGIFTDLMYAQRIKARYEYEQGVETRREKQLVKEGFFPAGGLSVGYTFNFNNFIIEPNMGIGTAFNVGRFTMDGDTGFFGFRDLDRIIIHLSTWHFELHIGYVF